MPPSISSPTESALSFTCQLQVYNWTGQASCPDSHREGGAVRQEMLWTNAKGYERQLLWIARSASEWCLVPLQPGSGCAAVCWNAPSGCGWRHWRCGIPSIESHAGELLPSWKLHINGRGLPAAICPLVPRVKDRALALAR